MKIKDMPSIITEGLYLGSMGHAADLELLKELKINKILIVGTYMDPVFPTEFEYNIIEVNDLPKSNIKKFFNDAHKYIFL